MPGLLQLTNQVNPLAQVFRVTEPAGSVITGIGIYFRSAPATSDDQYNVTLELRPIEASGSPSGTRFIAGTQTSATAAQIRAKVLASQGFGATNPSTGEFNGLAEYKFSFPDPVYIPENTEVAIVLGTSAPAGKYKVWYGRVGDFVAGSTEKRVTENLNAGGFFQSASGTSWVEEPYSDLAFKVYRAKFRATGNYATFTANTPPVKALTENTVTNRLTKYGSNPLTFTNGSDRVRVRHPAHGFLVGDRVKFSALSTGFDSSDTLFGVSGASILGTRTIDSADPYGYSVTMDQSATSTGRGGGIGLMATEQYVINQLKVNIPRSTPPATSMYLVGDLTTHKSFGGTETAYQATEDVALKFNQFVLMKEPHVIVSDAQKTSQLSGEASATFRVGMDTQTDYVAPFVYTPSASLQTIQHFVDRPQSTDSDDITKNYVTSVDYVKETQPDGGTATYKHLTRKFKIEEAATSIRVYIDAQRPVSSEFTVWYRTNTSGSDVDIADVEWTAFSKTATAPNKSNYLEIPQDDVSIREYEFNQFDMPSFDEYQIKVTAETNRSSYPPYFYNLRTIATV